MTASLDTPLPGDLPTVDDRIATAFGALALARSRFAEAPSGENVTACLVAEATVNELLELRLTLSRGVAPLGT